MTKRVRLFLFHTPSIPKLLITNLQISFTVHGDVQGVNFRYVQLQTRHHHKGEVHLLKAQCGFSLFRGEKIIHAEKSHILRPYGVCEEYSWGQGKSPMSPSLSPPQTPPFFTSASFSFIHSRFFLFFSYWATNRSKAKPKAPTSPCRNCSRISTVARRRRMWLRWRRVRWR